MSSNPSKTPIDLDALASLHSNWYALPLSSQVLVRDQVEAVIAELRAARKVVEAMQEIVDADMDREYGTAGSGYDIAWNAMTDYNEVKK